MSKWDPFARSTPRKKRTLKLLGELGGRARWSQLERKAAEQNMGPMTLKGALKELEEEGFIHVEAVRGPHGPEVWYILDLSEEEVFSRLMEKPVGSLVVALNDALLSLEGDPERQAELLEEELKRLIPLYLMGHFATLERALREPTREDALRVFTYIYDSFMLWEGAAVLGLCTTFQEHAPGALEKARAHLMEALSPREVSERLVAEASEPV